MLPFNVAQWRKAVAIYTLIASIRTQYTNMTVSV